MIGNDLVDLKLAAIETDWSRPRWREKVFTDKENALLDSNSDPFRLAWRMWSMKESAYKAHVRRFFRKSLQPKALECTITDVRSGSVMIDDQSYHTVTDSVDGLIHSRATGDGSISIISKIFDLPSTGRQEQHRYLENKLVEKFRVQHGLGMAQIGIIKNPLGIPILYIDGHDPCVALSFSYHGSVGAYALQECFIGMSSPPCYLTEFLD